MRTYKLYTGACTSSANNVVSTQIVRNGRLRRIRYAGLFDSTTDNSSLHLELSINPTSQIGLSSIQGAIDQISTSNNFTTSGQAVTNFNLERNLDFPIGAGEFLYVNTNISGTLSATFTIFVDVDEGK